VINRKMRLFTILLLCALMLSGCDIFRRARRVQATPPPPFQSPITEVIGRPGMTLPDIANTLKERQADTRSILGVLSIIVGEARSRMRLQFDANMYFAPPEFLRVRGAADQGTLFDFMMQGDQVQVMLVPEKKIHTGTLAGLRGNTSLMAGIQPDDLMYSFLVEQNLYRHLSSYSGATLQQTQDHYIVTVAYATGITENFHLRMNDLLVDRVERYSGRQLVGSVRYDGYGFYQKEGSRVSHLLPTRFEAQMPSGGVATVEARSLEPNAPRNQELTILEVPPDFQRLPL
jgi:hypothetical protein